MEASVSVFPAAQSYQAGVLGQIVVLYPRATRIGAMLYNDPGSGGGSTMTILCSSVPRAISSKNFSLKLYPTDAYVLDFGYDGLVCVSWEAGDLLSNCAVTEYY